jgi:hypothetical protein
VGPIHVTWFGVSVEPGEGVAQNVVAVTTTGLSESELAVRIANAHPNYEADGIAWIPLTLKSLMAAVEDPRRTRLRFSHLTAVEIWRYRQLIWSDLR